MNIGTLIATIGGDVTPLKGALGQANAALNKFSDQAEKNAEALKQQFRGLTTIGDSMKNTGKSMSMFLTSPLIGAGIAAGKLAVDWEQGMAKINTTAQLPKEGLKALGDQIYKLGMEAGADLSKVPEAYEKIISQTGDATLSTEIFTAALKGAKAGFTDISVVSGALAQSLSAIGAGKATAQEVTDVLFAAKRVGAGEFADFANYVPSLIASAKGVGVSWKETAGAFAYMTGKGNDAASSTMLLQNAFNALGKSEITGGLKKAGISVFDTSGKMRGLSDIFTEVGNKMNGMNDEAKSKWLESIGLKDQQAKQAFMVLSSETDKLKIAMDATANASGELNMALNMAKNPAQAFSEAMSKLKGAGIGFGEILLPAITSVIESISSLLGWIGSLTETQKKWVIGIGAVVAAIGPLLFGLGFIISNVIPKLITGWGAMIKVFEAVKNAMVLLNAAAMANPWMALAVALVAVGTAIYYFSNKAKELSVSQKAVNDVQKEAKKNIVDQKIATEELLKVAADETKGLGQRQEAVRKLNEISPEYFGNLTVETANSKEAQTACENYTKALENQALVKAAQDKIDKLRADNANAEIDGTKRNVTFLQKAGAAFQDLVDKRTYGQILNDKGVSNEIQANKDYEESIKALEKVKADAMAGLNADPIQAAALRKKENEATLAGLKEIADRNKSTKTESLGLLKDMEAELKKVQDLSGTFMTAKGEANNNEKINALTQKIEDFKTKVANIGKTDMTLKMSVQDTSMKKIKAPEIDLGGRKTDVFGGLGADLTKIRTDFSNATDSTNIFTNALKSTQGVQIKPYDIGTIGATKDITDANDVLVKSQQNVDDAFLAAKNNAKIMGESFNGTAVKATLLKAEVDKLNSTVDSTGNIVSGNVAAVNELGKAYRDAAAAAQFGQTMGDAMRSSLNSGFAAIGDSLGKMLAGTGTMQDGLQAVLGIILDFGSEFGKALIAVGVAKMALDELFKAPGMGLVAIGAGIALLALVGAVKSKFVKGNGDTGGSGEVAAPTAGKLSSVPAYASGSLSIAPHLAMVGDNPNASRDPELSMPVSKLQRYLDTSGGQSNIPAVIHLIASGENLEAIINTRQKRSNNLR